MEKINCIPAATRTYYDARFNLFWEERNSTLQNVLATCEMKGVGRECEDTLENKAYTEQAEFIEEGKTSASLCN